EDAQEAYKKALIEGRTAGLLEQERDDTFTQRLGALPAGQSARIEIETLQLLSFIPAGEDHAPCWEYRFPTVVGVRYEGAAGRVPDAESLDPDRDGSGGIPTRLALDLVIADGGLAALDACSPSHDMIFAHDAGTTRAHLGEDVRLDRDVVV